MSVFLKPLDDPYGYDAYRLMRSKVVPAGMAISVLGFAFGAFAVLLPHIKGEDAHAIATELTSFLGMVTGGALSVSVADNNALISLVTLVFLAIGFSLLGYARNNRHNYMTAYPRIKNFYTPSQKKEALMVRRRWIAAGIILLLVSTGIGVAVFFAERSIGIDVTSNKGIALAVGAFLVGASPSIWMITHGVIVGDRVDIFEYNYQALSLTNRYAIESGQTGDRKKVMLEECRVFSIFHVISRTVLLMGIFCTVMLWIVPSLHTVWAFIPLVCALIAWYAIYKIGEQIAKHRYELPDPDTDEVAEADGLRQRPASKSINK